jgi:uncharacterized protein
MTFTPHPYLKTGHLQTFASVFYPRRYNVPKPQSVKISLPDNDALLALYNPQAQAKGLLVVLHGLEDHADSGYAQGFANVALQSGYSCLRVNFRQCGGSEYLSKGAYHALRLDDLEQVYRYVETEGYTNIVTVGVSLGANFLLRYLGDSTKYRPSTLIKAIAISPPIDMARASFALGEGFNFIYDQFFLNKLRLKYLSFAIKGLSGAGDVFVKSLGVSRMKGFDDRITSSLAGFTDANQYFEAASSKLRLKDITTPTIIISAQDDPFIAFDMFKDVVYSPAVETIFPENGGHVGFVQAGDKPFWLETVLAKQLNSIISF